MSAIVHVVPFLIVAAIVGLIGARALRGRVSFSVPKLPERKKKRHLRVVDRDAMDRELAELLKRK